MIPQRRLGSKTRGFVCGYVHVLKKLDVEQEICLGFLKGLYEVRKVCSEFYLSLFIHGEGL